MLYSLSLSSLVRISKLRGCVFNQSVLDLSAPVTHQVQGSGGGKDVNLFRDLTTHGIIELRRLCTGGARLRQDRGADGSESHLAGGDEKWIDSSAPSSIAWWTLWPMSKTIWFRKKRRSQSRIPAARHLIPKPEGDRVPLKRTDPQRAKSIAHGAELRNALRHALCAMLP